MDASLLNSVYHQLYGKGLKPAYVSSLVFPARDETPSIPEPINDNPNSPVSGSIYENLERESQTMRVKRADHTWR